MQASSDAAKSGRSACHRLLHLPTPLLFSYRFLSVSYAMLCHQSERLPAETAVSLPPTLRPVACRYQHNLVCLEACQKRSLPLTRAAQPIGYSHMLLPAPQQRRPGSANRAGTPRPGGRNPVGSRTSKQRRPLPLYTMHQVIWPLIPSRCTCRLAAPPSFRKTSSVAAPRASATDSYPADSAPQGLQRWHRPVRRQHDSAQSSPHLWLTPR